MQTFEKLRVWQSTRIFVRLLYQATINFPDGERFGLISQMRRAAISISSNIAEGSGRSGKKDQAHFYTIAYGSVLELYSQLILANDLNYLKQEETKLLQDQLNAIGAQINGLKRATNRV